MKNHSIHLATLALLSAATLTLTACKSDAPGPTVERSRTVDTTKGVPGGVEVETYKITANVTDVDKDKRTVTVASTDGGKETFQCGPDVVNFDQIKVGDKLKAVVTEEVAVSMAPQGSASDDGGASLVALAPKGAKPGAVMARTAQVTATVTAIDVAKHKARLQFPDGTQHTVTVRDDVDLTQRKIGEKVVIRVTRGIAPSRVEKP